MKSFYLPHRPHSLCLPPGPPPRLQQFSLPDTPLTTLPAPSTPTRTSAQVHIVSAFRLPVGTYPQLSFISRARCARWPLPPEKRTSLISPLALPDILSLSNTGKAAPVREGNHHFHKHLARRPHSRNRQNCGILEFWKLKTAAMWHDDAGMASYHARHEAARELYEQDQPVEAGGQAAYR